MLVLYNGCTFITIRVKGEIKAMLVTGIKAYTPIRNTQSFAGNRDKDTNNKKTNKDFARDWAEMKEELDTKTAERKASSKVDQKTMETPMTI